MDNRRAKNSPFVKGHTINLGRVVSEETRRKISIARKKEWLSGKRKGGWKMSEETKKKISEANTGKKHLTQSGEKHYAWKGGISKMPGYKAFIQHRRRTRKRENGGGHTFTEWTDLKEKYGNKCLCCNQTEPYIKLTEDHILPLSLGGNDDIANIQPLCLSCNCRKKAKNISYV